MFLHLPCDSRTPTSVPITGPRRIQAASSWAFYLQGHRVDLSVGVVGSPPRQEALPFRSCCACASLLKAALYPFVRTQILLLPLTLCSRAIVFEPLWPLACIKQLVLFFYL